MLRLKEYIHSVKYANTRTEVNRKMRFIATQDNNTWKNVEKRK